MAKIYDKNLPKRLADMLHRKTEGKAGDVELAERIIPVFVINKDEILREYKSATATNITMTAVPKGEAWLLTNVYTKTAATAGTCSLQLRDGVTVWYIKEATSAQLLDWQGEIWMKEGDYIYVVNSNSGVMTVTIMGMKRYV